MYNFNNYMFAKVLKPTPISTLAYQEAFILHVLVKCATQQNAKICKTEHVTIRMCGIVI